MDSKEKEFFRLIGLSGTKDILFYLDEHGQGQHENFNSLVSTSTLNTRLRQLLKFGLITHHLAREDAKKEWYEITEKGRKVVGHLKRLIEICTSAEGGKEDELMQEVI